MHALVYDDADLIGHGAVVLRRMLHGGRALRTGYVEAVAVRADRRRTGVAGAIMSELERVIRGGYELGALGASEAGAALYRSRGWWQWPGTSAVLGPDGVRPTPDDDGGIYLLRVTVELDPAEPLVCDWRDGDAW
jgi:aminoglycoside 2'-N-acetyltransferase I